MIYKVSQKKDWFRKTCLTDKIVNIKGNWFSCYLRKNNFFNENTRLHMIYKVSQKKTDLAKQVVCYENYGQNMLILGVFWYPNNKTR